MKRERLLGGCLTLGVMLIAASFVFFGWSTPMRSLASFGTSADLPQPGPAESAMISEALRFYGVHVNGRSPAYKETICSPPVSTYVYSQSDLMQTMIYGYNSQHRRYGRDPPEGFEELEVREAKTEYPPLALREFGASFDPAGDHFLVPWPWQTARCDGWLSIVGPIIDDDRAFIEISRTQGAPFTGQCRWIRMLFLKDQTVRGEFRKDWTLAWSRSEHCYPVY